MSKSNIFLMHKKDYRVLAFHEGVADNPDYVRITKAEFDALTSGRMTGNKLLHDRFIKSRKEEIGMDNISELKGEPSKKEGEPSKKEGEPSKNNSGKPLTVEEFINGKSAADLRAIGKGPGLDFEFTTETRKEMGAQIVEKLNG